MAVVNKQAGTFEFNEPKCPQCKINIAEWECKEVLKPEEWAQIESLRLDITTANDPRLIKC
jgi:hypothetical protein